jgi:type IV secretory pathway TraG/TraD family ATPase VirD4
VKERSRIILTQQQTVKVTAFCRAESHFTTGGKSKTQSTNHKGGAFMSNEKKGEISDQTFVMVFLVIILLVLAKNIDRLEYWVMDHIVILTLIAISTIYATFKFLRWRYKMKHPDMYERELALKELQNRSRPANDRFINAGESARNKGQVFVGHTLKGRRGLTLTNEDRSGQVQIVGATGRGKTRYVIVPWYLQDLDNGNVPILIDGKGDTEIAERIRYKFDAKPRDGRLYYFDLSNVSDSCRINPLEGESAQQVADRLIASLEFDSSYFRDIQHAAALMFFEIMEYCREPYTLQKLYRCLTNHDDLNEMIAKRGELPPELKNELMRFQALSGRDKDERYSGLISQLRPFATGDIAELVNGERKDPKYLSLEGLMFVQKNEPKPAAIILLSTMRHQKTAKILGKMILQTFSWAASARVGNEAFTPIFLDEFSAFVYEGFEEFQNKARSYGVALHLSHQSLGDLEKISPAFAKTVNVNTNVKVLLGLNDPDTADYYAKHLGTKGTTKRTERGKSGAFGALERTGDMSLRDVEEYKVHPNRLRNYSQGVGVLSLLVAGIPVTEEVQFREVA